MVLAGPGVPHDRQLFTRRDGEGDIAEHPVGLARAGIAAPVREPDVLEADLAGGADGIQRRPGWIHDGGFAVEQAEDPLGRRHRSLEQVVLVGQVLNRAEEAARVVQEGGEHADRDGPSDHCAAPVPDDQRERHRGQLLDHREEQRIVPDRPEVRAQVVLVEALEALQVGVLAVEELHDADAGEALLQEGVHAGQTHPDVTVGAPDPRPEDEGGPGHERKHAEGDQRQVGVHLEHGPHDEEQREEVAKYRDHPRTEELVQRLHVGGDAGHEAADRVAVVEGQVEALEFRKDLGAQVVHDPLSQPGGQQSLRVLEDEAQHDGRKEKDGQEGELAPVSLRDGLVEGDLGQVGADDREPGRQHEKEHGSRHLKRVGPQVAEQPGHQPRVVGLAEDLLFVGAAHDRGALKPLPRPPGPVRPATAASGPTAPPWPAGHPPSARRSGKAARGRRSAPAASRCRSAPLQGGG